MKKFLFATMVAVFCVGCGNNTTTVEDKLTTKFVSSLRSNVHTDIFTYIRKLRSDNIEYSQELSAFLGNNIEKVLNGTNEIGGVSMYVYYINQQNTENIKSLIDSHKFRYNGQAYDLRQQHVYGLYTQITWRNSTSFAHLYGVDSKNRTFYALATFPAGNLEGQKP